MPSFSGKFQFLSPEGSIAQEGACRLSFEAETLTLAPTGVGAPIVIDLGDIDLVSPADYELALGLYTGQKILLRQFGKAFQNLTHDLLESYRNRLVQCLLLEDLEEVERFEGLAEWSSPESPGRTCSSPAEFRLYRSNLAVLPAQATGFQWRLAEIGAVSFDEANYAVRLESGGAHLFVGKLAKRTREFQERVQEAVTQLTEAGAEALHSLFPFLTPAEFQQVAQLMKEGRAVALSRLKAVQAKTERALLENVVDDTLRPYFDALRSRATEGSLYAGFKLLREQEAEPEADVEGAAEGSGETHAEPAPTSNVNHAAEESQGEQGGEDQAILYWFFFPLSVARQGASAANAVAWEATSKSGRATYLFRMPSAETAELLDTGVHRLNRALVLLNFRREPIYLPAESLEVQPRFRRYAIACRKIPELRDLRAGFVGRALHRSVEAWQGALEGLLEKALDRGGMLTPPRGVGAT